MWIKTSVVVLASILAVQQAAAQPTQQSVQILAQAYDRCMATHAVRLTRTATEDDAIYAQANQACLPLDSQLKAAINSQLPQSQATELFQLMDEQAKPNFMALLERIRTDRAQRSGS